MVKRISPMEGVLSTIFAMRDNLVTGEPPHRRDVFNDEIGEQVVDTCLAFDTHEWETGIKRDGDWTIVQQYKSRETAEKGHKRWVGKLNKNPELELKDIKVWTVI